MNGSILPDDLLERSPEEGARRVALALQRTASERLEDLERGGDEEALHDFRVAVRRLRSWMRAFPAELGGDSALEAGRVLGDIARSTGAARDAEVQVEWLRDHWDEIALRQRRGLASLRDRLEAETHHAYAGLDVAVAERFRELAGDLAGRLGRYRAHIADHLETQFSAVVAERAEEHARSLAEKIRAVKGPDDHEAAHRARIEGKRLRYLLEPISGRVKGVKDLLRGLKGLQELLGEQNDLRVLDATIDRFYQGAALARTREALAKARAEPPDALAGALRRGRELERSILALVSLTRARRLELFDTFRTEWGETGLQTFLDQVSRVAGALLDHAGANLEIERKYLLRGLPDVARDAPHVDIEQGWLPGDQVRERIRRAAGPVNERFTRTVKLGRGLRRAEYEEEIAPELFAQLWPLTAGSRVRKRRHRVRDGDHVWEVDSFLDRELVLAEVEFSSVDEEVALPEWLEPYVVREVTDESAYTNQQLAR